MLSCQGLTKRYGARVVLDGCSLSVAPGHAAVIRGPSGEGKSTLLRLLALLEPADEGIVRHDTRAYSFPAALTGCRFPLPSFPYLTLVFQQLYLWPNMSVRENIALVVERRRQAPLGPETMELLRRLKVEDVLDLKPHQCSLGQRQRAVVARAILTPAQYILLDEPTSALDVANRAEVIAALNETKQRDRGLVIVSHDDRGLEDIADANYQLQRGVLSTLV